MLVGKLFQLLIFEVTSVLSQKRLVFQQKRSRKKRWLVESLWPLIHEELFRDNKEKFEAK